MTIKTIPFDLADFIKTDEDAENALKAAFLEDPGDCSLICDVIGDIARARGMTKISKEAGLDREDCKEFTPNGNPSIKTFFKLCAALGISFNPSIKNLNFN